MASTLKIRGGDSATVGAITPAARELLVNTDTDRVHVGDGSTVGGNPLALLSDVTSSTGTTNLSGSGTASVYTIESDTGTNATIPAATNAAAGVATAAQITELEAIRTILGGVSGGTDLGTFTGSTLSDSSVLRTVLQEVETELEAIRASQGIAGSAADLGTFTGAIVSDNTTVKNAIQEIETDVDAIQTLTGVAAEATNLGTFTGDVITDNVTIAAAAQELETAIIKNRFTQGTEATAMDNTQNYIIAASGTVTLPASPFTGQRVWVYDATGAANTTNIDVNNSAAVLQTTLDQDSQFKSLVWDGSAWVVFIDSKAHVPSKSLHVVHPATLQDGQNYTVAVDSSAGEVTVTPPTTPATNQTIKIFDSAGYAGKNNIIFDGNTLSTPRGGFTFQYDGSAWQVIESSDNSPQLVSVSNASHVSFDGVDDRYLFPSSLFNHASISICAIVNYNETGVDQFVCGGISAAVNNRRSLRIDLNGKAELIVGDVANPNYGKYLEPGFHSIVGTFDYVSGETKVYIDGVLQSENTFSGVADIVANPVASASISSVTNAGFFNGSIYHISVYDKALTPFEVKAASTGKVPESAISNLQGLYNAESATSSYWLDQSGSNRNSTVVLGGPTTFKPAREIVQNLIIEDTSAPSVASGASQFYSDAGEMYVMDAVGNASVLSPHGSLGMFEESDFHALDPDRSFTGKSMNVFTGKAVRQYSFGNYSRVAVGDIYSGDYTVYDGDFNEVRTGNSQELIEAGNQFRSHSYFSEDRGEMLDNYIKESGISVDRIPDNIKSKSGFNSRTVINIRDNRAE